MRLDARKGDGGWHVWHVPRARRMKHVIWVDDGLAQWGGWEAAPPSWLLLQTGLNGPPVHQMKRIRIMPAARVVLLDPLDDDDEVVSSVGQQEVSAC